MCGSALCARRRTLTPDRGTCCGSVRASLLLVAPIHREDHPLNSRRRRDTEGKFKGLQGRVMTTANLWPDQKTPLRIRKQLRQRQPRAHPILHSAASRRLAMLQQRLA